MADAYLDLLRRRLVELRSAYLARDDARLLAAAREIGEQLIFETTDLAFLTDNSAGVAALRTQIEQAEDAATSEDTLREHEIERLTRELAEARKG